LRHRGGRSRPEVGWPSLTKTERKIVNLVAGGLSNSQVGERLFVSPRTIANHLTRIYDKLGVSSRTQLVVAARRRYSETASEKW